MERERERERGGGGDRQTQRETEIERKRQRERHVNNRFANVTNTIRYKYIVYHFQNHRKSFATQRR